MGPIKYQGMNTYSFTPGSKFQPFRPGTNQSLLNLTKNKNNIGSQSTIKFKPGSANVPTFSAGKPLPSLAPKTSIQPGDME